MVRVPRKVALVVPLVGWALTLGGAAYAQDALQGSDISWGADDDSRVGVCDREADGYGVHADGIDLSGNSYRVDDQDGSGGDCFKSAFMGFELLYKHRTVEERPAFLEPDVKGDWAYDY